MVGIGVEVRCNMLVGFRDLGGYVGVCVIIFIFKVNKFGPK